MKVRVSTVNYNKLIYFEEYILQRLKKKNLLYKPNVQDFMEYKRSFLWTSCRSNCDGW